MSKQVTVAFFSFFSILSILQIPYVTVAFHFSALMRMAGFDRHPLYCVENQFYHLGAAIVQLTGAYSKLQKPQTRKGKRKPPVTPPAAPVDLNDEEEIQEAFMEDVLNLCQRNSWCGLWQVFQMAEVLSRPIRSIFPTGGDKGVYQLYNRTISPDEKAGKAQNEAELNIAWSFANANSSSVNHFVSVVK